MLYESTGLIKYSIEPKVGHKVILEADQSIADYYFKLIPKYKNAVRQGYPAHISIVRKTIPANLEFWEKYDGALTSFIYDGRIQSCGKYWWINAYCKLAETIRSELGLEIYSGIDVPSGFVQRFHITVARLRN